MKPKHDINDILNTSTGELIQDDRQPQFSLMSKNLGHSYLTPENIKYHKNRLVSYITLPGGFKSPLPRYYRDKIFTRTEKAKINFALEQTREQAFIDNFDDSFAKLLTHNIDQERKFKKSQILERQKL